MNDLESSILLTMAPILVLMIGMIVYGVMKNRGKDKSTQSKREADALIEAKAMLAKYQKENTKNESEAKEKSASKEKTETKESPQANLEDEVVEAPQTKQEDTVKIENKAEKDNKDNDKPQKPSADAPIQDTTELEPDIDKVEE